MERTLDFVLLKKTQEKNEDATRDANDLLHLALQKDVSLSNNFVLQWVYALAYNCEGIYNGPYMYNLIIYYYILIS